MYVIRVFLFKFLQADFISSVSMFFHDYLRTSYCLRNKHLCFIFRLSLIRNQFIRIKTGLNTILISTLSLRFLFCFFLEHSSLRKFFVNTMRCLFCVCSFFHNFPYIFIIVYRLQPPYDEPHTQHTLAYILSALSRFWPTSHLNFATDCILVFFQRNTKS